MKYHEHPFFGCLNSHFYSFLGLSVGSEHFAMEHCPLMHDQGHCLYLFNKMIIMLISIAAIFIFTSPDPDVTWQDLAETQYADTWPEVVNSAAQLIRWTDQTWGAVANVLGGGTSINGGLYIEEEADYFQENFGEALATRNSELLLLMAGGFLSRFPLYYSFIDGTTFHFKL